MAWQLSMWKICALCHKGLCFAAQGLFSLSRSVLGAKKILISGTFLTIFFNKWRGWRSFCLFRGCIHFPHSFSFPASGSPSLRPPVCLRFTVNSNTTGCSEPLGMKSRLISDGQITASSSFRTWGIDTFTWQPQFARLDKQGKTNAWSPAHNNRSEWIQVRVTTVLKCQYWLLKGRWVKRLFFCLQ